jgi:hypothetical protein
MKWAGQIKCYVVLSIVDVNMQKTCLHRNRVKHLFMCEKKGVSALKTIEIEEKNMSNSCIIA